MTQPQVPADLRTPKQIAKLLDVHVTTVRRWLRAGVLPGWKVGGRLRASLADLSALVKPADRN